MVGVGEGVHGLNGKETQVPGEMRLDGVTG